MPIYHGIQFPEEFENPRFVQTVSGAFTIQIDYNKSPKEFTEEKRQQLASLTRKILQNLLHEPVLDIEASIQKKLGEKTNAN